MKFRFIHCADIHFGKGAHVNHERYGDYFRAFTGMAGYAVENKADAVLIAGDLFDEQEPSAETILRAMEALRPLRDAGIPVYAIEGNHDRRKRTENACALDILAGEGYMHLLRPEIAEQQIQLQPYRNGTGSLVEPAEGICIAGLGFIGHNPEVLLEQAAAQLPADRTCIAMYHTMVVKTESRLEYGYCLYDDIAPLRERIAYLALGHRHTRVGMKGEFDGWIFNPGSLEYVNPSDYRQPADLRGFFDVTITGSGIQAEHISSLKRPSITIETDITNCRTPDALRDAVLDAADVAVSDELRAQRPIIIVRLTGAFGIARHTIPRTEITALLAERYGAVHADVLDDDLVQDAQQELLWADEGGLGEVGDKARAVMVEIMRGQGIAVGEEDTFTAALLEWKDRLAATAESPKEELLEEMRAALARFTQQEGGA